MSSQAGPGSAPRSRSATPYNLGGIDFLIEHYEAEHLLPLAQAVDDLALVTRKAGGKVA